jgi:hypothetical protein
VAELDGEPGGRRGVATRTREAVAALVRLDRSIRVQLVAGGETGALERLRRLLERKRVGEPYAGFGPGSAR